jgi:hypothetical protein
LISRKGAEGAKEPGGENSTNSGFTFAGFATSRETRIVPLVAGWNEWHLAQTLPILRSSPSISVGFYRPEESTEKRVAMLAGRMGSLELTAGAKVAVREGQVSLQKAQNDAEDLKGEVDFRKWPKGWNTKTHNDIVCDFSVSGYRLPTEAEWEFAAKGGGASGSLAVNAVYAGSANLADVAWYSGNSGNKTHSVGQKNANALGLYDMAGNVWEGCWDIYADYTGGSQRDPVGASSGANRVDRGGSWGDGDRDLRSTNRFSPDPGFSNVNLGFRLARRP